MTPSPDRHRPGTPLTDLGRTWVSARSAPLIGWAVGTARFAGDERVLDLACASGRSTAEILRRVPDGFVDATDPSARLVAKARRRNHEALSQGRLVLHRAALPDVPTWDGVFDTVVGVHAPYLFLDPLASVTAALRALRPGGRLVLALTYRHNLPDGWRCWMDRTGMRTYRPRELGGVLAQAGFADAAELAQPGGRGIAATGLRPS